MFKELRRASRPSAARRDEASADRLEDEDAGAEGVLSCLCDPLEPEAGAWSFDLELTRTTLAALLLPPLPLLLPTTTLFWFCEWGCVRDADAGRFTMSCLFVSTAVGAALRGSVTGVDSASSVPTPGSEPVRAPASMLLPVPAAAPAFAAEPRLDACCCFFCDAPAAPAVNAAASARSCLASPDASADASRNAPRSLEPAGL